MEFSFATEEERHLALLYQVDQAFFSGVHSHLPTLWDKINAQQRASQPSITTRLFETFLWSREQIYLSDTLTTEAELLRWLGPVQMTQESHLLSVALTFELNFLHGGNALDPFWEHFRQIVGHPLLPVPVQVTWLQVGSVVLLTTGQSPYRALQLAQMAQSLASRIYSSLPHYLPWTLARQAQAWWVLGDLVECEKVGREALSMFNQLNTGIFLGKPAVMDVLMAIAMAQGDFDRAVAYAKEGQHTSLFQHRREFLRLQVEVHLLKGELGEAWALLHQIQDERSQLGMEWPDHALTILEAQLLTQEGRTLESQVMLERLLSHEQVVNDSILSLKCHQAFAELYSELRLWDEATAEALASLGVATQAENSEEVLRSLLLLIHISLESLLGQEEAEVGPVGAQVTEWLATAHQLAVRRGARLLLVELELYRYLYGLLIGSVAFDAEDRLAEVLDVCKQLGWTKGIHLSQELLSLVKLVSLHPLFEADIPLKDLSLGPTEVSHYLRELKQTLKTF